MSEQTGATVDLLAEFRWLMDNSRGVVGLRLDGGLMPWREVLDLYLPTFKAAQLGRSEVAP